MLMEHPTLWGSKNSAQQKNHAARSNQQHYTLYRVCIVSYIPSNSIFHPPQNPTRAPLAEGHRHKFTNISKCFWSQTNKMSDYHLQRFKGIGSLNGVIMSDDYPHIHLQ